MDEFIGFDIDHKHTVACVVQAGQADRYSKLPSDAGRLRAWLKRQRGPGDRLQLTFEVSGLSGHLYDGLVDVVDRLEVSNPTQLSWIYLPAVATMAILLRCFCPCITRSQKARDAGAC